MQEFHTQRYFCYRAQENNLPRTTTDVSDGWVHPSLHHPHTKKQGVEIHRSFNAKAMTIDQAPS
jgi:hypothetical protein